MKQFCNPVNSEFCNLAILQSCNPKRGQILIESLVAITIAVVGLLGIFSLLSRSLSLNRVIADQYTATNLATEGVEVIKNLIDTNLLGRNVWDEGIENGIYKLDYKTTDLSEVSLSGNCTTDFIKGKSLLDVDNVPFLRFDEGGSGLYVYDNLFLKETSYKRAVCIEKNGDTMKVNSIVTWITRGGTERDINMEDRFWNWQIPPPSP